MGHPQKREAFIYTYFLFKFVGGLDYNGESELLTFPPGVNELCTSFASIIGDSLIESTETFLVSLTAVNTPINVGVDAVVTILDDDRKSYSVILMHYVRPSLLTMCMM